MFDEVAGEWTFEDTTDERARIGFCPCVGPHSPSFECAQHCRTIVDGNPGGGDADFWNDDSIVPNFPNQAYDPAFVPSCVDLPSNGSAPQTQDYQDSYRRFCTDKSLTMGTHDFRQSPLALRDTDKAVRLGIALNSPSVALIQQGEEGSLRARYSVRNPLTPDWNEDYLSSVNVTTTAIDVKGQDCTFLFSVENWISNHDMRIIPEVDLGMSGRPTWWMWTADDGRNMVLRLGPQNSDVEEMLQTPAEFRGAQTCGQAGSGNETCMVFGKLDGARIVSFVRGEWDGVQWNTKDFNMVGNKFALAEPVLTPLDAKTSLLVGISSKGAAAYRVDFSDMTATVTALGVWGYTHATGVQTTSGPWIIFSKAGKAEFFRYDGKTLHSKWSTDVSAPVATAAWPGTLLLMFAGNRQVYEADPDKGVLLPVWSALPEDKYVKKYSLTSSPHRMILGMGDHLWLTAWQWSANDWMPWPVWEEVLP